MTKPSPERVKIRLQCVHNGRTFFPYVASMAREGLLLYHHSTRSDIPYPWRELIRGGAELYGCTPEEFLDFLRTFINDSGPSAPTAETSDGGTLPQRT